MAPDDDPEKRIRELERGRAAELGSSSAEAGSPHYGHGDPSIPVYIPPRDPYPPPPPPSVVPPQAPVGAYEAAFPPPASGAGYGSSFPPPPAYTRGPVSFGTPAGRGVVGAFGWGWLLFMIIPLVGVVITGAVLLIAFRSADDVTSQYESLTPSISFEIPAPPGQDGSSVPTATSSSSTISVSGVSEYRQVVCDDAGLVSVSGVSNTVEITGHCDEIRVSGVKNVVKVESADTIGASGVGNRITYSSGAPDVSASGDNVVERG